MGKASMLRALATRSTGATRRAFQTSAVSRAAIPGEVATTEHAVHATADWKKYSLYGAGFVGLVSILELFVHLSHSHHEEHIVSPFRRIRNKPFPWGDGQHSLFGAPIDDCEAP